MPKARKTKASASTDLSHPDHANQKSRLNRIRGQIDGIERMLDERRYCVDIVQQIKAARSALSGLESAIIETHLRSCVKNALNSNNAFESEEKIQEIMKIIS